MVTDTQLPDHFGDVGVGWTSILQTLHYRLIELAPDYKVVQVKEKFGGLRTYLSFPTDEYDRVTEEVRDAVWAAEEQSYKTCEDCGQPGMKRESRRWIRTLCDTCAGEGIDILKGVTDAHR